MANVTARTGKVVEDELVRIMRGAQTRMPWSLGSKYVEKSGLHVSRGWKDTIEAAKARPPAEPSYSRAKDLLQAALAEHTLVGNKQVIWYAMDRMNEPVQKGLRTWGLHVDPEDLVDPTMKEFKLVNMPWRSQELKPMLGQTPQVVSAVRTRKKNLVVRYFGARSYTSRETIDISEWPADQRRRIGDYFELIGLKARNVPIFDVLIFDFEKSRIELRIDVQPGMTSDGQGAAHSYLIEAMNRVLLPVLHATPLGIGLVNLFPAADKLYRDKKAGQVESLGFVATGETTASNNTGHVHRRRGQDLRDDPFHTGGRGAVKSIKPYSIGVSWDAPSKLDKLLLELKGSVRMIHGSQPAQIQQANFLGCANREDFQFLADALESHLPT